MTTPPTDSQIDAFMNSQNADGITQFMALYNQGTDDAAYLVTMGTPGADNLLWVIAYTDHANQAHFEGMPLATTGVTDSSDAQIEATSPPVAGGGGPFSPADQAQLPDFQALPYLQWLRDTYGEVRIRGYILPVVPWPTPLGDSVQTWVNDTGNWPSAS
jgi:hypothetical protein